MTMDDSKYRLRKLAYAGVVILLYIFSALLLILFFSLRINAILIVSIVFFAISIIFSLFYNKFINGLKNRYKEYVISDAFIVHNFLYVSRLKGIKKNKYAIGKEEYDKLNYYKTTDEFTYNINELVVGDIRTIDFRSEDYSFKSNMGNTKKCGRIYSFNLKSDPNFKLIITKNDYSTNLKKIDLDLLKYNFYSNDQALAIKYIHQDKFLERIEKTEKYGDLFIEIIDSSLYLIIDGVKNSFEVENREYSDISEDVEKELFIMNNIIESFNFEFKPHKEKVLKIR